MLFERSKKSKHHSLKCQWCISQTCKNKGWTKCWVLDLNKNFSSTGPLTNELKSVLVCASSCFVVANLFVPFVCSLARSKKSKISCWQPGGRMPSVSWRCQQHAVYRAYCCHVFVWQNFAIVLCPNFRIARLQAKCIIISRQDVPYCCCFYL